MTKSIKKKKTFKSNKKGGSNRPIADNYNVFQTTTIKQVPQVEEVEEVEDEIYNLFIILSETECTKNNSIILNSDDVNYLIKYIKNKNSEEKTKFQNYLQKKLKPIKQGCKFILDFPNQQNLGQKEYQNESIL